ncbi:sporulation membrane protein YtrI [Ornithinibacillus scapharcae]|uniref:sporulation membrane protein YtrI n=1 Tax=Ornithinibacillus scapharcae TaxID=1147159 RepID=UPI000225C115|nr:sporulation membrane protein YtrI [Ornithinibacillus scapharcae]
MHVPRYHKKPGWQRFLVGVFFGGLISYWVVLFMYGTMYERLIKENSELQNDLTDANSRIEVLMKDNESLDEKSRQPITIEGIQLQILNAKDLNIDSLLQTQLEGLVKEQIKDIIGKDIKSIADSDSLIFSSIENKTYVVDDFTYSFDIERLILVAPTVRIVVIAKISN